MGYAFISYSSKNQSAADALRDLLNSKGIETWMAPGDIPVGSSYMKEINHALKNCSCLVLLLSNAAQGSQWVIKEVERAVNYHKPVIPVQIEDVILNDEFEFVLGSYQVVAVQKIDQDSSETKKILNSIIAVTEVNQEGSSCDTENQTIYLVSIDNKDVKFALKNGLNIIGTDSRKATVVLNSQTVSRIHAVISISEKNTIRDVNATNGTYINEQRLAGDEERIIYGGDIVKFGDEQFIIHIEEPTINNRHYENAGKEENDISVQIGTIIDGKYKIIAKLGDGVFTKVYLAENQKTKKKWAIKVIDISQDNYSLFSERLSNEINILNKLQHPYLPSIADIIHTKNSLLVVMDFIEGVPLAQIIHENGAQSEEIVVDWSKKICDALRYLHSRTPQIIHNDIHPKNIMLKSNGDISLIDFGTAIEYTSEPGANTVTLGTTYYAAPERFGGIIDARTDIYSFGMTIYALITGKDPSAPPYAIYPLRRVNPDLSLGLEYIVNKCIARNPLERYQNTCEVLEDLENIDRLTKKLKNKKRIGKLFSQKG